MNETITVTKGFRYRIYPTDVQKQQMEQTFGNVRFVYNCYVMTNVKCRFLYTLNSSFYICLMCLLYQGYKTGNFNLLQFYGSWPLCYTGIGYPQVNGYAASLFCL